MTYFYPPLIRTLIVFIMFFPQFSCLSPAYGMDYFFKSDFKLGEECYRGKDLKQAFKHYQLAANKGMTAAQIKVGDMYLKGEGITKDSHKALDYYKRAAEAGDNIAQFKIGALYESWEIKQDYQESFKYYKLSAAQFNAQALYNLGVMYERGRGIPMNRNEAIKYYKAAAYNKNITAQKKLKEISAELDVLEQNKSGMNADTLFELGLRFEKGQGVKQDYRAAFYYYTQAAKMGHLVAGNNLGVMYDNGWGTQKNHEEAAIHFKSAADHGVADAYCNLAIMYECGRGVPMDRTEALKYYTLAAGKGHKTAQEKLQAMSAENELSIIQNEPKSLSPEQNVPKNHENNNINVNKPEPKNEPSIVHNKPKRRLFEQNAPKNNENNNINVNALEQKNKPQTNNYNKDNQLSDMNELQEREKHLDIDLRLQCYEALAEKGNIYAQLHLVYMYLSGFDGQPNLDKAFQYCRFVTAAADQGNVWAQFNIGYMSYQGYMGKEDLNNAFFYFKLAADNQDNPEYLEEKAEAQYWLASMYYAGEEVSQNYQEAFKYYVLSSNAGNLNATFNLGYMYYHGLGISKNFDEAIKYFMLGADRGNPDALFFLKNICYYSTLMDEYSKFKDCFKNKVDVQEMQGKLFKISMYLEDVQKKRLSLEKSLSDKDMNPPLQKSHGKKLHSDEERLENI